ncbi:MAG: NrsF family protein [Polyangiaceae bacterium]
MDADFDLSRLDEIPDFVAAPAPPRAAPAPRPAAGLAGPARDALRKQRALAVTAAVVWLVAQVATLGLRTDLDKLGKVYPLVQIGGPALLAAAALALAAWPSRDGLGASSRTLGAVAWGAIAALAAATIVLPLPFDYTPPPGSIPTVPWALVCADIVLVMGALPLAIFAAAWRRSFPAASSARTAALGAAAGLGAVTSMHLHCENIFAYHVVVAHMIPAALLAAAGAFVLHRITRA